MKFFIPPSSIFSLFLFVAIQTIFSVAPGSAYVGSASFPVTRFLNPTDPLNPGKYDEVNDHTATMATRLGGVEVLAYSSSCVLHDWKNPNS